MGCLSPFLVGSAVELWRLNVVSCRIYGSDTCLGGHILPRERKFISVSSHILFTGSSAVPWNPQNPKPAFPLIFSVLAMDQ